MKKPDGKVTYEVEIHFLNLPVYKSKVRAINSFHAVSQCLKESGCGENDMYDNEKTKAKILGWF